MEKNILTISAILPSKNPDWVVIICDSFVDKDKVFHKGPSMPVLASDVEKFKLKEGSKVAI